VHKEICQLHAALHAERSDAVSGERRTDDQVSLQLQGVDGGLPPLVAAQEALATLRIEGVRTTVPFHRRVLEDPGFQRGEYDLGFLARAVKAA